MKNSEIFNEEKNNLSNSPKALEETINIIESKTKIFDNIFLKIFLRILYLTPLGYLLSLISLLLGRRTKGIFVVLKSHSPIRADIKENPTPKERINWFINGVFLLVEGFSVLIYQVAGDFGGTFAMVAIIFGLTSVVASLFPKVSFNKKFFWK